MAAEEDQTRKKEGSTSSVDLEKLLEQRSISISSSRRSSRV